MAVMFDTMESSMPTEIVTTRFNQATWEQNCDWRRQNQWEGCIYGSPTRMKDSIGPGAAVAVIEMNNQTNRVEGIGLLANRVVCDKRYAIYEWGNYNRFVYRGRYRIDRRDMSDDEAIFIEKMERILFWGLGHLKRGHGMTRLPRKTMERSDLNVTASINKMFTDRFKSSSEPDPR
jgi:hypothetical protein